uniref:Uncharacterized protein n=1 Tax=Anguilla anguilla TaxID=7936 RepID=A0A0E9VDL8_ANGAN
MQASILTRNVTLEYLKCPTNPKVAYGHITQAFSANFYSVN